MAEERTFQTFEEIFDYYLKISGYFQKELAHKLNASESNITKWKKGIIQIPETSLKDLYKLLGVKENHKDQFFGLAGYPQPGADTPRPTVPPTRLIPLIRPAPVTHFTGREDILKSILKEIKPTQVVTLCGPPGIGKSALISELVRRLAPRNRPPNRFSDGVIYHDFYSQPQTDTVLEEIARAFNQEPKPTPESAARRVLDKRKVLLVLDGVENADDLEAVLAVQSPLCGVLMASRRRRDAPDEQLRYTIAALPESESVNLLKAWGGKRAGDNEIAFNICELVGGLPLAIRLVGSYLNAVEMDVDEYLQWLKDTPLEALDHGKRQLESVPILLQKSLEQVSKDNGNAERVLAVAGILAFAPFSQKVIEAGLRISKKKVSEALRALVNYSLLERPKDRYQITHPLIHTYARQRLTSSEEMLSQLATYYTDLIEEQSEFEAEGYARLNNERLHFMRILGVCKEQEAWEATQNLALSLIVKKYLELQGYLTDFQIALNAGLIASDALGDRSNEELFLTHLGYHYHYNLSEHEQAIRCFEWSLTIALASRDFKRAVRAHNHLGTIYHKLGHVKQLAIEYYQIALEIARRIEDYEGEGRALNGLGIAYHHLGQPKQAIEYYEQALDIARKRGNREDEAITLMNLGSLHHNLGETYRAIEYHKQALKVARESGNRWIETDSLLYLGYTHQNPFQVNQAIEYHKQALKVARESGNRRDEIIILDVLGSIYRDLDRTEQAIECYKEARNIADEMGDRQHKITIADLLNNIDRNLGQLGKI